MDGEDLRGRELGVGCVRPGGVRPASALEPSGEAVKSAAAARSDPRRHLEVGCCRGLGVCPSQSYMKLIFSIVKQLASPIAAKSFEAKWTSSTKLNSARHRGRA
jgi:hypothetical protein